jgi:RND superfamily putative drug exporter
MTLEGCFFIFWGGIDTVKEIGMFNKLGNLVVKFKLWIILGWVLAAALLFFLAPSLSEVGTMNESNFLPADSESLRARELIAQYFPQKQSTSTVTLVFYNPQKLGDTDMAYAQKVEEWLTSGQTPFKVENVTSIFQNPELESQLVSPDGTTMLLNAGLAKAAFESESTDTTAAIREYLTSKPQGLEIYVSGQVGIYSDLFQSLSKSIKLTTIITIILIVILLIIIYRSPVAALVPLLTIGVGLLVARGIMGIIGQAGVSIWSQIDVFLVVLVFGIGTDYCLFLVSRFREELRQGADHGTAMRMAVSKIGVVITASAFAVIAGLVGMAVARYQMIQTMGPALGIAILVTLLASLTLAPALASIFGRNLFWPRHEERKESTGKEKSGLWHKIADLSSGKPLLVIAVALVVMILPYLALPGLNRSFDQMNEIPPGSESVSGFHILEKHFNIGEMDPPAVTILAPVGQDISSPVYLNTLVKLSSDLRKLNNVVKVQSIVQPDGSEKIPEEMLVSGQISAISTGLVNSFSNSSTDPSLLFSEDVGKAFIQINTYLEELAGNFSWVSREPSYQAVISDLQTLKQTIESIKSNTLASPNSNPMDALKSQFSFFTNDLNSLSQKFSQNGNPLFLSKTLMSASSQFQNLENIFFSQDKRATQMYIVLDAYPQSDTALTAIEQIRTTIKKSLKGNSLNLEVVTGGSTAELADVRQVLGADFTRVMVVVLAAIFLVLVFLLRSFIAPFYLLLTVLLSYGTTLGIVSWIFQRILGQDGISFIIPIIVFVLLVALGSDYNIFLISRVREESATRTTRMGTRLAVIATGGVITACGIILSGTFGALLFTPIRTLMQIGAAISIGVLLDTFVVRALLVPAIASLLGRWNWWPVKHG